MAKRSTKKPAPRTKHRRSGKVAFTFVGKPLTSAEVTSLEHLLCPIKFPRDYRRFLLKYNGGEPEPSAFTWKHRKGQRTSYVDSLLGFDPSPLQKRRRCDCVEVTLSRRDNLPRYSIPIGFVDRDDLLLLFVFGPREGQIWIKDWDEVSPIVDEPTNPESAVYFVADSFNKFINLLHQPAGENE